MASTSQALPEDLNCFHKKAGYESTGAGYPTKMKGYAMKQDPLLTPSRSVKRPDSVMQVTPKNIDSIVDENRWGRSDSPTAIGKSASIVSSVGNNVDFGTLGNVAGFSNPKLPPSIVCDVKIAASLTATEIHSPSSFSFNQTNTYGTSCGSLTLNGYGFPHELGKRPEVFAPGSKKAAAVNNFMYLKFA
jgi:hypothetical protein